MIAKRLQRLIRSEQGSFTLESALVMPILLLMVLIFLLFGLYTYQKVVLYYSAGVTAERAAFSWDNSSKDPRSGIAPSGSYDELYWRVGSDKMLESVLGLPAGSGSETAVTVPQDDNAAESADLASFKLIGASRWLSDVRPAFQGEAEYENSLVQRSIQVKLQQPITLRALELMLGKQEPKEVAAAGIVDPVEFIRSVDLARYYGAKLSNGIFSKKDAGAVLADYTAKSGGGKS